MIIPFPYPVNILILAILNLLGICLAFRVYWSNKSISVNKGFSLLILPNLLWIDFYNLAFLTSNSSLSLFFTRLTFSSVFIFFISFYYFFIVWFLGEKGKYLILGRVVVVYEVIFALLCAFTNLVIKDINVGKWGIVPTFSTLGSITFHLPIIILVIIVIERLTVRYFKSTSDNKRKIQYFLLGVYIFVFGNLLIGVILPFFFKIYDYYFVTNYLSVIFLVLTSYAIVKHHLFNIKILVSHILVFAIWVFEVIRTVMSNNAQELLINGSLALLVFIIGILLLRSISKEKELSEKLHQQLAKKTNEMIKKMEDIVRE